MISRIYSVDDEYDVVGYKGFDKNFKTAKYIAIIIYGGETEMWALDDSNEAVKELLRFMKNSECYEPPLAIKTFLNIATFAVS